MNLKSLAEGLAMASMRCPGDLEAAVPLAFCFFLSTYCKWKRPALPTLTWSALSSWDPWLDSGAFQPAGYHVCTIYGGLGIADAIEAGSLELVEAWEVVVVGTRRIALDDSSNREGDEEDEVTTRKSPSGPLRNRPTPLPDS